MVHNKVAAKHRRTKCIQKRIILHDFSYYICLHCKGSYYNKFIYDKNKGYTTLQKCNELGFCSTQCQVNDEKKKKVK